MGVFLSADNISKSARTKNGRIAEDLRRQIVSGRLRPSDPLPIRDDLRKQFSVSNTTIQAALDRLAKEGFVHARPRAGTFVVDHPPHLYHYGLLVTSGNTDLSRNHFWQALARASTETDLEAPRQIRLFTGVQPNVHNKITQRVERHVLDHRLAGLIFSSNAQSFTGTPILSEPGIARIAFSTPSPGVVGIALDRQIFWQMAIERLSRLGRRRLAVITRINPDPEEDFLLKLIAQHGMISKTAWRQASPQTEEADRRLAMLLMDPSHLERPDALVIADDNLVPGVTAGIAELGIRCPGELAVIAHTNYPSPTEAHCPVFRLGWDARTAIQNAVETIDQINAGNEVPDSTRLLPVFEDSITAGA